MKKSLKVGVGVIIVIAGFSFVTVDKTLSSIETPKEASAEQQQIALPLPVKSEPVVQKPAPVVRKILPPDLVVGAEITPENILNGVNNERRKLGLPDLKQSVYLEEVAQNKLGDMIKYDYWAHDNPETGKTFYDWFKDQAGNLHYKYNNENLARDFTTTQEVLDAWMKSPTHYQNITHKQLNETGIAISGNLVVQAFGGIYIK